MIDVKELTKAIFYSEQNPEALAEIIANAVNSVEGKIEAPEDISEDVELDSVTVDNGTSLDTVKATLPTKTTITTSKGYECEVSITWGADTTPTYDGTTAGDYVLSGTLSGLPLYLTNTSNKVAKVTITVEAAA